MFRELYYRGYAGQMRSRLVRPDLEALPDEAIEHGIAVIDALYRALKAQGVKPFNRKPVHGWGLISTTIQSAYNIEGPSLNLDILEFSGTRELHLATNGLLRSVLQANHPKVAFESMAIANDRTSVPEVLAQDPSVYPELVRVVRDEYVGGHDVGLDWPLDGPRLQPVAEVRRLTK